MAQENPFLLLKTNRLDLLENYLEYAQTNPWVSTFPLAAVCFSPCISYTRIFISLIFFCRMSETGESYGVGGAPGKGEEYLGKPGRQNHLQRNGAELGLK